MEALLARCLLILTVSFFSGVHNLRSGAAVMYVWDESKASRGPEEIGSCLLHYFKKYVATKNVIMYSDACGGQNRNIKMALFCQYVVQSEHFDITRIRHNFLVSGHSFLPCDSDFGVIEKNKRYNPNIFVPSDWIGVIRTAKKKTFHCGGRGIRKFVFYQRFYETISNE